MALLPWNTQQKLDDREVVRVEEAIRMEMIINQTLIDLLIEKGIMTEQELMDKIEAVKRQILAASVPG